MMDAWGARVDFTNTYGMPSRPYEERVMDTRVVALPADVLLPAALNVS